MSNDSWQERRDAGLTKQLVELREKEDLADYASLILFDTGAFKAMLRAADFGYAEGRKDERENAKALVRNLEIAANRLEGVALAIRKHGQNISPEWFIESYEQFAVEVRRDLAKYNATLAGGEK